MNESLNPSSLSPIISVSKTDRIRMVLPAVLIVVYFAYYLFILLREAFGPDPWGMNFLILIVIPIPLGGLIAAIGVYFKKVSYYIFSFLVFILFGFYKFAAFFYELTASKYEQVTFSYENLVLSALWFIGAIIILQGVFPVLRYRKLFSSSKINSEVTPSQIVLFFLCIGFLRILPIITSTIWDGFNYKTPLERDLSSPRVAQVYEPAHKLIQSIKDKNYTIIQGRISSWDKEDGVYIVYQALNIGNISKKEVWPFELKIYENISDFNKAISQIPPSGGYVSENGVLGSQFNYFRCGERMMLVYRENEEEGLFLIRSICGPEFAGPAVASSTVYKGIPIFDQIDLLNALYNTPGVKINTSLTGHINFPKFSLSIGPGAERIETNIGTLLVLGYSFPDELPSEVKMFSSDGQTYGGNYKFNYDFKYQRLYQVGRIIVIYDTGVLNPDMLRILEQLLGKPFASNN